MSSNSRGACRQSRDVEFGDDILRRETGRGGTGIMYEAWECAMERRVAVEEANIRGNLEKPRNRFECADKSRVESSHGELRAARWTSREETS